MAADSKLVPGNRLDSWKQIAAFFDRAERTVKRWESERGLPVHRVPGGSRSAVFAYTSELADWLKGRSLELETEESAAISDPPSTATLEAVPVRAASAASAVPARISVLRLAAWIVPLTVSAALIVLFSMRRTGTPFKALASRHVPNAVAQDFYLKGRYFWERRTPEDLNQAIDYFTQAIVKDPSDAQAYVGLADCYNLLREFGAMPPSEAYPRALAAAQRAVELDDSSAEAHNSLAFVSFWWSWRASTAEREFKRAIELNPNLVRAHHWYATFLMGLHRNSEALDQIEQAQRLEPSSTAILADKALLLADGGRQDEAVALLTQLQSVQPSFASTHGYLGKIYGREKEYAKALPEWRRLAELRRDKDGLALADVREKGFASGGEQGMFEAQLPLQKNQVDHGSGSAFELAATYAALGRIQEALPYLQIAFDRHEEGMLTGSIPELETEPQYQKLRTEIAQRLAQ